MGFYDEMQGIASGLLKEFKQGKIEYVRVIPGAGSFDEPGVGTEVKTELDAAARGASFKYVTKGLAIASDKQVVSHVNAAVTPNTRDAIDIDGVRYKIVHFEPKPSAGTAAAWLFIVRKGAA
ncbi:MAG TPA: hypothetical protein PK205_07195 [Promineifilum sp.]|nr:hypothetical protein [Promineifilum sp.]